LSLLKPAEHCFKSLFLTCARPFLKMRRQLNSPLDVAGMSRVLFLRPEKIGDMVISLPVFDALKKAHPHVRMSVLASPRSLPLIKNDPRFEKIFVYDKSVFGSLKLLRNLRKENFDCILDMIDNDSATTLICSQYVSRHAPTIGIGKGSHAQFYDFNHSHDDGIGGHIIDNTLKLLLPLGVDIDRASRFAPPYVPDEVNTRIDMVLRSAKAPDRIGIIGVNLSAGQPNRMWPLDKFIQLIDLLNQQHADHAVLLIVAPSDRSRAVHVASALGDRVSSIPDGLNLTEVSAVISGCDLLVSPDTSLIHIARSFDVPVVGLYNRARKNFTRWQPFEQPDGFVVARDKDKLDDIAPEQVAAQVSNVFQRVARAVR